MFWLNVLVEYLLNVFCQLEIHPISEDDFDFLIMGLY